MRIRQAAIVLAAAASTLLVPSPALAHIDPDPTEAQAGSRLSVGFTVEHGCDGSPTTSLDMRLPDGVTDARPEAPQGWQGSVEDNVVTFAGGPLPDDEELTFNVALTLPPTPDTTVYFPFVQRCEAGEIRWIDVPSDGSGDELDEPAPAMALIGPIATTTAPQTTTTVSPATTTATVASETTVEATTSTSPSPTQTTAPAVTDAPADTEAEPSTTAVDPTADADDDSEDDGNGLLLAIALGVAVVLAGAAVALAVRRRSS
jgi:periplasmic copper chaperone A